MPAPPIRIGISACLTGAKGRYDGGHKHDPFLMETLGRFVEFVPVCPEVECGLGVPREPMRLVGTAANPRLVTIHSGRDLSEPMLAWAKKRVVALEGENLSGFIFKGGSPTSGMARVKVFPPQGKGGPSRSGVGLFARVFMEHFPLLPVEDEGRMHDPALRENFITRIFVLGRWRGLMAEEAGPAGLVEFHARHKLLLLAHSEKHARSLGRIAARAGESPPQVLFREYEHILLAGLACRATVKKNCNVLQHMAGYFKKNLSAWEKQELQEAIEHYREGYVPLVVPLTLIGHYVGKHRQEYLAGQYYLHPHPVELGLRNHV